jgi:hypothetical protein
MIRPDKEEVRELAVGDSATPYPCSDRERVQQPGTATDSHNRYRGQTATPTLT